MSTCDPKMYASGVSLTCGIIVFGVGRLERYQNVAATNAATVVAAEQLRYANWIKFIGQFY